ncbi:MAG: hypothetical protein IGR76_15810 [Synechococcales cyanobacterium T60_A2020_003]|nr:hypothetical protein [Synechococcales cyanobacterium T60_A2020_003]
MRIYFQGNGSRGNGITPGITIRHFQSSFLHDCYEWDAETVDEATYVQREPDNSNFKVGIIPNPSILLYTTA